jgi:hypothetical protein
MKTKFYSQVIILMSVLSLSLSKTYAQSTLMLPNTTTFKGSVGIGANAPRGVFDVNAVGDIYLNANPNAGSTQSVYLPGHLFLAPYSTSNISYLQARRGDNSGNTELQLRTTNAGSLVDAVRINNLGNIGIGLTSPSHLLSLKSKGNSTSAFSIQASSNSQELVQLGQDNMGNGNLKIYDAGGGLRVNIGGGYPNELNLDGDLTVASGLKAGSLYSPFLRLGTHPNTYTLLGESDKLSLQANRFDINSSTLNVGGNVGIASHLQIGGTYTLTSTAAIAPLWVATEKTGGSVAYFENTSPYGDGITIRIKANGGGTVYGSDSDFIKFAHWNPTTNVYYTNGAIEGYRYADWLNNYAVYNLCDLHDMLGVPDGLISLVAAYANAQAVGACMDDGVRYKSTGADYAEYLPKEDPKAKILPASVVGVKNGKISYKTEGADQVMAISTRAVVLGNMPQEDKKDEYETVAFIGQVHVWVVGEVKSGDFIVASGKNNGSAIAISPEKLEINDIPNIVGRSWESKNLPINLVNTVVGVKTSEVFEILKKESAKTQKLEASINELKNEFVDFKNSFHLTTKK